MVQCKAGNPSEKSKVGEVIGTCGGSRVWVWPQRELVWPVDEKSSIQVEHLSRCEPKPLAPKGVTIGRLTLLVYAE